MSEKFITKQTNQSIKKVVLGYQKKRADALDELGFSHEEFKKKATETRKKVFENFEKNLKIAKENLQKNGFVVHCARNEIEARGILQKLTVKSEVIAKAKTNTGREIEISKALEDKEVFETDLGDAIVELFEDKDQHYVLPALHVIREIIRQKILEKYGDEVEADPQKLTHYLCGKIRKKILSADTGITGANFFTKNGQIVLLENEGNISLVSRLPKKHIILVGIDKLAQSVEDATFLCRVAAVFGTGQKITQYISIISGPSRTADIENVLVDGAQGTHEVHVILLDNKRLEMLESEFSDLARCINCGACINFCPVYHQEGNKYGGGKYIGAKGIITSSFVRSLESAKEKGSFDCTLCGACTQNCPMSIDLAGMIRKVRQKQNKDFLQTKQNQKMLKNVEEHGNPFGKISEEKIPDKLYCC